MVGDREDGADKEKEEEKKRKRAVEEVAADYYICYIYVSSYYDTTGKLLYCSLYPVQGGGEEAEKRAVEEAAAYYYICYIYFPHTICVSSYYRSCVYLFFGKKKSIVHLHQCMYTPASYYYISVCPAGALCSPSCY